MQMADTARLVNYIESRLATGQTLPTADNINDVQILLDGPESAALRVWAIVLKYFETRTPHAYRR